MNNDHISEIELERRGYRKKQTVKSVLIAALSTFVIGFLLIFFLSSTPGWSVAMKTFFNWEIAVEAFPRVWKGFLVNLKVLLIAAVLVAIFGMLIALARSLRGAVFYPLRLLATVYTDVFRGIPLIVMLYLVGFGIPALRLTENFVPYEVYGTIAITITYSAYVAEVFRSGIESVHPSQRVAARSLGFSHGQTMRLVILPQGIRRVTPALMNDFVALQKDVGLLSVVGVVDAIRAAQIETSYSFNYTPYVVAAVLFMLLAIPTIRITDWYTERMRKKEQAGFIV